MAEGDGLPYPERTDGTPTHSAERSSQALPGLRGTPRSESEAIPEGFTKADADLAERMAMAPMSGCQVYWPSPHQVCGAIRDRYNAMGGPSSWLSWPNSPEYTNPDGVGKRSQFLNGSIYWHPTTGAHPVSILYMTKWDQLGWETGWLGYPTAAEVGHGPLGSQQEFQGAGLFWSQPVGVYAVGGAIRTKYDATGGPGGFLGYPVTDEITPPDGVGRFNTFKNHLTGLDGSIYWHPTHGAHSVRGDILEQWALLGYESSSYGYPTGEPVDDGTGWFTQQFVNGTLAGELSPPSILDPVRYIEFASREEALAYFDSLENELGNPNAHTQQEEALAAGGVTYGPCTLTPNHIHWRTKSGAGSIIGFKPKTQCTVQVTSIEHETDLRYQYYWLWRIADSQPDGNHGKAYLEQKNLAFRCTGEVATNFGGRTLGTIVYAGKTYYAAVNPPRKRMDCKV